MISQVQRVTALLPMKGHSERVPNKNIRDFYGRPLFHWVLESLLDSPYIYQVVINTDSEEIAENALKHFENIQIVNRPENIQGDFVSMNDIIDYDLSKTQDTHYLQTHSTNPLLTTDTINRAIIQYFNSLTDYDSLFSVTRAQTRLYWGNGSPINHNPEQLLRTQDLEPVFEENSNLYLFSKKSFVDNGKKRIGLKPSMFEVDRLESIDIDEIHDFKIAEILCAMKLQQKEGTDIENIKIEIKR